MSGQWEVVGRKKGKESLQVPKKTIKDTKKNIDATPKLEEILPLPQVKNLYASSGKVNKENHKPQENKKKIQENGTKNTQKKPEKPQEPPKLKPPKSIESALNSINADELKYLYENNKKLFPDGPVVWLKELAQYLNQHIGVDIQDPVFSSKPSGYPFSIVPAPLKSLMERAVKEAGKGNLQMFFDITLTSMATDMGKNLPALGHKLFLQYLAQYDYVFVGSNLTKYLVLRNSYQNRQSIGLSILWALGQVGLKDFNAGLKVFQELMLALIEMKNYSRFVVKYLIDLVNRHAGVGISKDQYLLILDVVFASYKNFPNELRQDLNSIVPKLNLMLLSKSNKDKYHTLVEPLLRKLLSNKSKLYCKEICDALVVCFTEDQSSFDVWSKLYMKNIPQSAILLTYIEENWKILSNKFNKKVFLEFLKTYSVTNDELLSKKRKEDGVVEAAAAMKKLTERMAVKKTSSSFPYKLFSFVILLGIGTLVLNDINKHKGWEKSRTYNQLKDAGVIDYTQKAVERSREGILWVHERIDEQFPQYYEKTSAVLQPYVQLSKDLALVLLNLCKNLRDLAIEKYPAVVAWIESYAPGLIEKTQKSVTNACSTFVVYLNRSLEYLKNEVFVGQLAPENMQRVVLEAFNTTQQKAAECYHWIYEKVQSAIK